MAKYTNLTALFTAIADAIRAKKGTTGTIVADNFPDEIDTIQNGIDLSGVTAEASDVLTPKVFVNSEGETIVGSIPTKTSSDITTSANKVSIPAGYYANNTSKSISTVTQATPSITVSSSGLITAKATQSAGYVASGTKSGTKQLTTQGAKTYTPGSSDQTIPAGTYLTGTQTIKAVTETKNGLTFSYNGGDHHYTVANCRAPGLNNRMPTVISLVSMSLDGATHNGEDGCNGILSLYATVDSNGYLKSGVVNMNGGWIDALEVLNSERGNVLQITPYGAETFEFRCLDTFYFSLYGNYVGTVII